MVKALIATGRSDPALKAADLDHLVDHIDLVVFKADLKTAMVRHFTATEMNTIADTIASPNFPAGIKRQAEFTADLDSLLEGDRASLLKPLIGEETTFRLGGVAPLTGEAASFGLACRHGADSGFERC